MLDKLSSLREKEARLIKDLATVQSEISGYQAALSEFVKPTTPTAPHTQTYNHPTQAVAGVHNRTEQATMAPTATPVQPTNVKVTGSSSKQSAAQSTTAAVPQTKLRPSSQPTGPSGGIVPGVIDILANRAPYHTQEVQICGISECGQVLMYDHYLAGDGVNTGIPTPKGYNVKLETSKAGKVYRLLSVPALEITCTLTKPLPEDFITKKKVLKEWMIANDYLRGSDPNKAQFYTEYNAFREEYTPFVCVDGIGTKLRIYIGCESLSNAKPMPTLIA